MKTFSLPGTSVFPPLLLVETFALGTCGLSDVADVPLSPSDMKIHEAHFQQRVLSLALSVLAYTAPRPLSGCCPPTGGTDSPSSCLVLSAPL